MTSEKPKASAEILPFKPAPRRQAPCPVCGKPSLQEMRPFCSKRCADVDLGRWLNGSYRVPTEEVPSEEDLAAEQPFTPPHEDEG